MNYNYDKNFIHCMIKIYYFLAKGLTTFQSKAYQVKSKINDSHETCKKRLKDKQKDAIKIGTRKE